MKKNVEQKMRFARICGFFLLLVGLGTLQAQAETGSFERTLQVSGPVNMEVASGSGSITVRIGGNGAVHILAKIRAHDSWFGLSAADKIRKLESDPPIKQQGNAIRVGDTGDLSSGTWWFRWLSDGGVSIDYDLTVPAQTGLVSRTGSGDQWINGLQLPSTAKTGSGNITVENMAGDLQVSSGSGDLKIDSVKGALNAATGSGSIHAASIAGDVSAATGSGNVEIQQVAPGNAKITAGSGHIDLRGIHGGLRIDTGSGGIHVEGEPVSDWHLRTGSGNIDLRLPTQLSFTLDAGTSSGSVKVDRPLTVQGSLSRNHLQGNVGNGGVLLEAHAASGNIEIN